MSGALDKKMRNLADKLLKKFGKQGEVVRGGGTAELNDLGQLVNVGTPSNTKVTFYIDSDKTTTYRSNNTIEHNESIALISAKQIDVLQGDILKSTSGGYDIDAEVVRFISVWSGEKVALYEAVVVV